MHHRSPKPGAVDELCELIRAMSDNKTLLSKLEQVLRMVAGLLRDTQFRVVMALLKTIEVRGGGAYCGCIAVRRAHGA